MKFSPRQNLQSFLRRHLILARRTGVTFGANVFIGRGCSVSGIYRLSIGKNVYIGKNVTIEVEGSIGNGVVIANNVGLIGRRDHDSRQNCAIFFADTVRMRRDLSLPLIIEDDCWIGYGAIVLSGVTVGQGSLIAAGAVVKDDVPKNSIFAGNPAVRVGERRR